MDYTFQLDQTDEYLLQCCYSPPFQFQLQTNEQEAQKPPSSITQDGTQPSSQKLSSFGNRRRKSSSSLSFNEFDSNPSELKKGRKIMHRDVERQRRQQMATLYASLRSLLPVEYLKGKRSVSDHMHHAVNYIKNLQKKIEELNNKRDKLRKLYNPSSYHYQHTGTMENSQVVKQDVVTVRPFW